jgi:hypothetical protein
MEYRLKRHDGMYRWFFDRGVPYSDDHGNFLGYIGSCVDVAERIEGEARSRRWSRLMIVGSCKSSRTCPPTHSSSRAAAAP